ncbi:MAG: hypothetical protein WA418_17350 [Bradyrhizobium sp.]
MSTLAALTVSVWVAPSAAQVSGPVRVNFVKAALILGGGAGNGVPTYRGRNYPFRITGLSLGISSGASIGWLDGWASGIREIGDFAGAYSSVGGGAALVGGVSGVHLRNDKGITVVLRGPEAGMEVAANLSRITMSLK